MSEVRSRKPALFTDPRGVEMVYCHWFETSGKPRTGAFAVEMVERAK
jgi:hypothetical protein